MVKHVNRCTSMLHIQRYTSLFACSLFCFYKSNRFHVWPISCRINATEVWQFCFTKCIYKVLVYTMKFIYYYITLTAKLVAKGTFKCLQTWCITIISVTIHCKQRNFTKFLCLMTIIVQNRPLENNGSQRP